MPLNQVSGKFCVEVKLMITQKVRLLRTGLERGSQEVIFSAMSDFVGFTTGPTATQAKVQTEGTVCLQCLLSYYYLSVTHSHSGVCTP